MSFTYCSVEAEFGPMGYATIKNIHTKTFFRPVISEFSGMLFIFTLLILIIAVIYYT